MYNLKVGDKVLYKYRGNKKDGKIGIIKKVDHTNSYYEVKATGEDETRFWFMTRTFPFTEQINCNTSGNEWTFPVQSIKALHVQTLIDDLTMEKPIQLIEIEREGMDAIQMVTLHDSLLLKALQLKIKTPNAPIKDSRQMFLCTKHFGEWVDWAKKVKHAPWGKGSIKSVVHVKQIAI